MARTLLKHEFQTTIREQGFTEAKCFEFGGMCLGDGCIHWMPLPSTGSTQKAACLKERKDNPISSEEALRKAAKFERMAMAEHSKPEFRQSCREQANLWRQEAANAA